LATYKQIQVRVKKKFGFVSETCWISDIKSQSSLPKKEAPSRKDVEQVIQHTQKQHQFQLANYQGVNVCD